MKSLIFGQPILSTYDIIIVGCGIIAYFSVWSILLYFSRIDNSPIFSWYTPLIALISGVIFLICLPLYNIGYHVGIILTISTILSSFYGAIALYFFIGFIFIPIILVIRHLFGIEDY